MVNMVNWPHEEGRWKSTGEGGLYAFLVVPTYEEVSSATGGCCICTYTYMTRPDVCVSPESVQIWEPIDWNDYTGDGVTDARNALEAAGHKDISDKLSETIGYGNLSVPLDASVFLGATDLSLFDERREEYFQVGVEDLNPAGRALYDALAAAHVNKPVLLTFLDT